MEALDIHRHDVPAEPELVHDDGDAIDRENFTAAAIGALLGGLVTAGVGALLPMIALGTLDPGKLLPGVIGGAMVGIYLGALMGMSVAVEGRGH